MQKKNFIHKNESFTCLNCDAKVSKGGGFIRNHCPFCLCSLHVDLNVPGDRLSPCHGIMKPVSLKTVRIGEYKIKFQCTKCSHTFVNKVLPDDNMDKVIELSTKPFEL